jgi:alginate O-acetyltransferase complex protein AlgI
VLFHSYFFMFFFVPITVGVFFWLGGREYRRLAVAWLVGASLFFYGWWDPHYLALIVGSILFNYAIGRIFWLRTTSDRDLLFRGVLALGIAANLVALGYFKYFEFLVENLGRLTGSDFHIEEIVLPLAISFFTFQQIAYLVDAWKGEVRENSFLNYCLFVTFFPQLIAGPIVHHTEMLPQFFRRKIFTVRYEHLAVGLAIFFAGLFKKVVLADGVSVYSDPVFAAAEAGIALSFLEAWGGSLAYTFQIYFDFSGYSDMAIGLARMLGIRLPLNFNAPYKAVNIIEFWRRWHMTLSRFLRDYLYFPLGGNRKGPALKNLNLVVTMLLGGLWHGADWNFVLWGAMHGCYLILNHSWRAIR